MLENSSPQAYFAVKNVDKYMSDATKLYSTYIMISGSSLG
jgi:hypothetical protein